MRALILIFMICIAGGCTSSNQEQETSTTNWYGEAFDLPAKLPGSDLGQVLGQKEESEVVLSGEIQDVCKMKGCWMVMKTSDGQEMRVTFKDYGFFVPKEGITGKTSILKGVCQKKETSVETLRHYAQDAGKSQEEIAMITEPKLEYAFEATGVAIID